MASKITLGDIALFTRQLVTMMKAGVPLVQSLEIVAEGANKVAMRDLTLKVRDDVAAEKTLANALREHAGQFDVLFCSLVEAGEQAGALELMLDSIATYKEKTVALVAKIRAFVNYSLAVLVTALCILLFFSSPLIAFETVIVIASLYFIYSALHHWSAGVREGQQRLVLKLPILGDIVGMASVARFSRTLATTFGAGVPLVEALESVSGAAGNIVHYNAVRQIKADVSAGVQLNHSMKQTEVFPDMVIRMVAIGEESGSLDVMLDRAATYYEEMVENALDGLVSLMQPISLGVLWTVIIIHFVGHG
jgi:type IV pilus assembly protein PilC